MPPSAALARRPTREGPSQPQAGPQTSLPPYSGSSPGCLRQAWPSRLPVLTTSKLIEGTAPAQDAHPQPPGSALGCLRGRSPTLSFCHRRQAGSRCRADGRPGAGSVHPVSGTASSRPAGATASDFFWAPGGSVDQTPRSRGWLQSPPHVPCVCALPRPLSRGGWRGSAATWVPTLCGRPLRALSPAARPGVSLQGLRLPAPLPVSRLSRTNRETPE